MSASLAAVPTQGAYMSTLPAIDPALARRHLIALARGDGYYELRALRRQADDSMLPGGSFWLPVNGGRSQQIDRALQWASRQYQGGAEVFVGYNPRITPTGSKKEHVGAVLACYADLDLHGQRLDEAQAALAEAPAPPSLLVHSGYGLHPIWFLAPSADKARWFQVQRGIATAFAAYAPDSAVVSDEARVLRLVPYPNRKYGDCIPTAIVAQSGTVYTLAQLALVYPAPASEPHGAGRPPTIVTTNRVPLGLQRYAEAGLKHGERNKGAFWLACRLIEEVSDDATGYTTLELFARRCAPALAADEIERIWQSARNTTSYDPSKAASAPPAPMNLPRPAAPALNGHGPPDTPPTGKPGGTGPERAASDSYTDLWNAEQLVTTHGDELRYSPGWGWLIWDKRRWARDALGQVHLYAAATVRGLYTKALAIDNADARQSLVKHAIKSEGHSRLTAMVERAQHEPGVACTEAAFDRDPWLFNVANGTIDLRTGELRAHARGDLLTKLAAVRYDADAGAPTWERFLAETFAGQEALIAFVQRAVGYTLTALTREQVMFLLHGTGSNGKSTFLQALHGICGDYAKTAKADTLLVKPHDNGQTNDIAELAGARLLLTSESEEGTRLNESLIKQMTGGDRLRVRELYRPFFELTPTWKVWFATNHKPTVRGADYAIWRRLLLIPFSQRFVKTPADAREGDQIAALLLPEKLTQEMPGILAWAVAGCLAWQRDGLNPPPDVVAATTEYQNEQDVIGQFLNEECHWGEMYEDSPVAVIYNAYCEWARKAGEKEQSKRWLSQRLTERGFSTTRKTGGVWHWVGLALVQR
jgi:putative DNA primase/helicase